MHLILREVINTVVWVELYGTQLHKKLNIERNICHVTGNIQ